VVAHIEEHRLRVFENRVLRKIFCPEREQVAEEWWILHNEVLHEMYSSANIIWLLKLKRVRWVEHVMRMGGGACGILVGKREGESPLGRLSRRWEDNIETIFENRMRGA
jgi:hypothetical protein